MRIKFNDLYKALDHLRYLAEIDATDRVTCLDIELSDEDIGNNTLVGCLSMSLEYQTEPKHYSAVQTVATMTSVVDVFPDSDNRPPRLATTVNQELTFKKD